MKLDRKKTIKIVKRHLQANKSLYHIDLAKDLAAVWKKEFEKTDPINQNHDWKIYRKDLKKLLSKKFNRSEVSINDIITNIIKELKKEGIKKPPKNTAAAFKMRRQRERENAQDTNYDLFPKEPCIKKNTLIYFVNLFLKISKKIITMLKR